jgi:membrane protein
MPSTAASPSEITQRGWSAVVRRAWRAFSAQNVSLMAAGIAFYGVWALFPALVAAVVLGGLLLGQEEILHLLSLLRIELPQGVDSLVVGQLAAIARQSRGFSSLTLIGALLLALWSATRGVRGLIEALNMVYQEEEKRSFLQRHLLAFCLACLGGIFLVVAIILIVAVPIYRPSGEEEIAFVLFAPSRWPILILAIMTALSVLYRYAPSRRKVRWRWVTWGAALSATVWVLGSFLFSYYASQYTHLNPLLGSLGGITIFLFWCYLTVLTVLFGAQINAELERQATGAAPAGDRPKGR